MATARSEVVTEGVEAVYHYISWCVSGGLSSAARIPIPAKATSTLMLAATAN